MSAIPRLSPCIGIDYRYFLATSTITPAPNSAMLTNDLRIFTELVVPTCMINSYSLSARGNITNFMSWSHG